MKWAEQITLGESLEKEGTAYWQQQVEQGEVNLRLRIITLAANGVDYLDIRPALGWAHRSAELADPLIVGMAKGKKEALELVRSLVEQCYRETGHADVRAYLLQRSGK